MKLLYQNSKTIRYFHQLDQTTVNHKEDCFFQFLLVVLFNLLDLAASGEDSTPHEHKISEFQQLQRSENN